MKSFYEIVGSKKYYQLSMVEKSLIQERQNELVVLWQDETNEFRKEELFDELHDSLKGLIKSMSYREAERSFSVEREDFEGLINLVLVNSLIEFDRSLDKPFQPVFVLNVRNEIKMMYRQKGYDLHDTTYVSEECRLDSDTKLNPDVITPAVEKRGQRIESNKDIITDCIIEITTSNMLDNCFGDDERKKTVITMVINDFKRSEIVQALNPDNKSTSSVERWVNRTLIQFKDYYRELTQKQLA